jgi:hypothetical protein
MVSAVDTGPFSIKPEKGRTRLLFWSRYCENKIELYFPAEKWPARPPAMEPNHVTLFVPSLPRVPTKSGHLFAGCSVQLGVMRGRPQLTITDADGLAVCRQSGSVPICRHFSRSYRYHYQRCYFIPRLFTIDQTRHANSIYRLDATLEKRGLSRMQHRASMPGVTFVHWKVK